jgi:hypothetical protein
MDLEPAWAGVSAGEAEVGCVSAGEEAAGGSAGEEEAASSSAGEEEAAGAPRDLEPAKAGGPDLAEAEGEVQEPVGAGVREEAAGELEQPGTDPLLKASKVKQMH